MLHSYSSFYKYDISKRIANVSSNDNYFSTRDQDKWLLSNLSLTANAVWLKLQVHLSDFQKEKEIEF